MDETGVSGERHLSQRPVTCWPGFGEGIYIYIYIYTHMYMCTDQNSYLTLSHFSRILDPAE